MPLLFLLVLLGWIVPVQALQLRPQNVYIRGVDVSPGLCAITRIPGDHFMVYDAGHWNGEDCLRAVQEIVQGHDIALLILSHSDADHLGDAADILDRFRVWKIIRTGFHRTSGTWINMNERIGQYAVEDGSILNLQLVDLILETVTHLGDAQIILLSGWKKWMNPESTVAEKRNAICIVVRLQYHGHSVLFGGDTIGRRLSPDTVCKDAETRMVGNVSQVPLQSDVMIAPHHGGNNGSSSCFISAVNPTFVIFSAWHKHHHPSDETVQRYSSHGIAASNMFRTDRNDDEGGFEWSAGRIAECKDPRGDDDIDIVLQDTGDPFVGYREVAIDC